MIQVAVGNDASVYLVNNFSPGYYYLYSYNAGPAQLAIFPNIGQPNDNSLGLTPVLSVGADGDLWSAGRGNVYHYNPLKGAFDEISNPTNIYFTQVAAGSGANVWALDLNGTIYRWDAASSSWTIIPGSLTQIATGADGSVWGINSSNQVYHYIAQSQPYHSLIQIPGSFSQISVAPDGTAWAVDANNFVYIFDRVTQSFQIVPGELAQVSVGSVGTAWGVNAAGQIWAWGRPTQDAWTYVPGELNQIAVSANRAVTYTYDVGQPFVFGINASGQTYTYDNGWMNIPGTLAQISVGQDGTAWGINAQQQIYRYDSSSNSWINVPGSLTQISVGSANIVWGVNAQHSVYHYDTTAAQWTQISGVSFNQVSAAFDGSVWGVSTDGGLYQWDTSTQKFNQIGQGVTNVAVANDNVVFAWNTNTGATYWYF